MFDRMAQRRDQRPYNVKYYERNRQQEIDRVVSRQRVTLEFLRELRRVPCKDCGGRFAPHQMDFDHRDPVSKSYNIMSSRAMLKPRETLLREIAKCDVVCANCHAARTYATQAEAWSRRRAEGAIKSSARAVSARARSHRKRQLLLDLRDRPCCDCGIGLPPQLMQFDHREPKEKRFLVANSWCRTDESIISEAQKCDIVCPSCHRDRTFRRRSAQAGVG